ncbi:MAG: DUF4363 family protein [Eubacterium sp.]|nr:DUF4363 family protein [Eubacterium sp.]
MKRLWFAIIFLIVTATLCTGEQLYIEDFYRDMSSQITAAEKALDSGNEKEFRSAEHELEEIWQQKNDLLYAVGEHHALDGIAVQIRSMPYGKGEEIKELHSLRAQLFAYYENEKISFPNIF